MGIHNHERDFSANETGGLKIALGITALMTVAEVIGGLFANSIALLSDAGHMFTDTVAISLSLAAVIIARKPATSRRTYGFHRFEIFVALINGTTLLGVAVYIFYESFMRFIEPSEVRGGLMLVVATLGLFANLLGVYFLKEIEKKNLNIRGAFLHMLGDTLSSLGVIIGGLLIYFTGWYIIDPIVGVLIGGVILRGAVGLVLESSNILLEAVPGHISVDKVNDAIHKVKGIRSVHDLHLWSITSGIHALSAHIIIEDQRISESERVLNEINRVLRDNFNITHTTLQLECNQCEEFYPVI